MVQGFHLHSWLVAFVSLVSEFEVQDFAGSRPSQSRPLGSFRLSFVNFELLMNFAFQNHLFSARSQFIYTCYK